MPALVVQRYAPRNAAAVPGDGTQAVASFLTITQVTYVEFDPEIFGKAAVTAAARSPAFVVFTFADSSRLVLDPVPTVPLKEVNLNTYLQLPAGHLATLGWSQAVFALTEGQNAITVTFS